MKIIKKIPFICFGLLFAGVGSLIAAETLVPTFTGWWEVRNWQPARAEILTVNGGKDFVKAEYRYRVNGVNYTNDRVYVASFNDNIGNYHANLYTQLNQAFRNGREIEIWVNPRNNAEAIIDNRMRWGLFALMVAFCGVFIIIGLAVGLFTLFGKANATASQSHQFARLKRDWHRSNERNGLQQSFNDYVANHQPQLSSELSTSEYQSGTWRQRKGWQSGKIRSGAKLGVWLGWGFAIFWNGVSSPVLFHLPEELEKNNYAILVALVFPLVGLFLLYRVVQATLEYLRFGVVELRLDPYPGAIGGHVGGIMDIRKLAYDDPAVAHVKFVVTLECVYSYISGSGKNRSRRENTVWAEQGDAEVRRSAFGIQLGFRFTVPDHLPEAEAERGSSYHFWRLTVKAELPGADLNRKYDIPVYRTGKQSSDVRHDISAQVQANRQEESQSKAGAIARGDFHLTDLKHSVKIQDLGSELRLYYPMFRNKGLTLFALIFAGGFSFAVYGINASFDGGFGSIFSLLFSIPFALVALVANIAVIYLPFNNLSITISGNTLTSVRRLLFIPISRKTLSFSEITDFAIKRSGSTGQGVKKVVHFKIHALGQNGNKVTVAEDIDGEDLATHFKDYIARRAGK